MKYVIIIFILLPSIYTLNFAKYNWSKNNKLAAIGSMLLAIISVTLPTVLIFIR